jgi:hypothetical protein
MPTRIPKFGNVAPAEAKELLDGYLYVKESEIQSLNPGDNIKYAVEGVLKGGGILKAIKFPEYLALKNRYKSISWCVQLKEPTLQMWVKTQEMEAKEVEEKKKIWQLYKSGKIMQIPKDYEQMKEIYDLYKSGKLINRK